MERLAITNDNYYHLTAINDFGVSSMSATAASPSATGPEGLPSIASSDLFRRSREIRIRHEGEEYRLRITSNNKLILTK
jgi:hemin uptake protein HemP